MAVKKSRQYSVDGNSYAFEFVSEKLAGIKKSVNGVLNPIPPKGSEFASVSSSDEALDAYRIAKYESNKTAAAKETSVAKLSDEELQNYYDKEVKKADNEQFVDNVSEQPIAFASPDNTGSSYASGNARSGVGRKNPNFGIMAYPLDIDTKQDHFKITKYKYVRPNINQSKSARVKKIDGRDTNVAGDSVIGSQISGSIILPMPKATDANAAQWGGSDLTVTDLMALQTAKGIDQGAGGIINEILRGTTGRSLSGLKNDEVRANNKIRRSGKAGQSDSLAGDIIVGGQAISAQSISKLTGLLGANFDTDTFLARTGGRVLNPNAEMLFQGPVIRDFSFEFQMIARSRKEGEEIRKIIRFLKLGMAPKFQNIAFLANPDVFKLEYRNDTNGTLKTVNRFNPGGLALTALKTDYAPNGYWAAYTDSQPVALKLALSFTELRPIYEGDQAHPDLEGTVGY